MQVKVPYFVGDSEAGPAVRLILVVADHRPVTQSTTTPFHSIGQTGKRADFHVQGEFNYFIHVNRNLLVPVAAVKPLRPLLDLLPSSVSRPLR